MNKKTQISILALLAGSIAIGFFFKKWIEQTTYSSIDELDAYLPKNDVNTSEDKQIDINHDEFPLQLGSRGPRVERLKIWLLRNYGLSGQIDNYLDQSTEKQMKKYLKTDKLEKATYDKLKMDAKVHEQKIRR
jgi:peptidoglycan hydrolase-like protein with peptidoglycan-binding domain